MCSGADRRRRCGDSRDRSVSGLHRGRTCQTTVRRSAYHAHRTVSTCLSFALDEERRTVVAVACGRAATRRTGPRRKGGRAGRTAPRALASRRATAVDASDSTATVVSCTERQGRWKSESRQRAQPWKWEQQPVHRPWSRSRSRRAPGRRPETSREGASDRSDLPPASVLLWSVHIRPDLNGIRWHQRAPSAPGVGATRKIHTSHRMWLARRGPSRGWTAYSVPQ